MITILVLKKVNKVETQIKPIQLDESLSLTKIRDILIKTCGFDISNIDSIYFTHTEPNSSHYLYNNTGNLDHYPRRDLFTTGITIKFVIEVAPTATHEFEWPFPQQPLKIDLSATQNIEEFIRLALNNELMQTAMQLPNPSQTHLLVIQNDLAAKIEAMPGKIADMGSILTENNAGANSRNRYYLLEQVAEMVTLVARSFSFFGPSTEARQLEKLTVIKHSLTGLLEQCVAFFKNSLLSFPFNTKSASILVEKLHPLINYNDTLRAQLEKVYPPSYSSDPQKQTTGTVDRNAEIRNEKFNQLSIPTTWMSYGGEIYVRSLGVDAATKHTVWINHSTFDIEIYVSAYNEHFNPVACDNALDLLLNMRTFLSQTSAECDSIIILDKYFRDLALAQVFYFTTRGDDTIIRAHEDVKRLNKMLSSLYTIVNFSVANKKCDDNAEQNVQVMLKIIATLMRFHILPVIADEHNKKIINFSTKPEKLREDLIDVRCNAGEFFNIISEILQTNAPGILPGSNEPAYFSSLRALSRYLTVVSSFYKLQHAKAEERERERFGEFYNLLMPQKQTTTAVTPSLSPVSVQNTPQQTLGVSASASPVSGQSSLQQTTAVTTTLSQVSVKSTPQPGSIIYDFEQNSDDVDEEFARGDKTNKSTPLRVGTFFGSAAPSTSASAALRPPQLKPSANGSEDQDIIAAHALAPRKQ